MLAVGLVAGVLLGALLAPRRGPRPARRAAAAARAAGARGARDVLQALPLAVLVVDASQEVLLANRRGRASSGWSRAGCSPRCPQLRRLVDETRRSGQPPETELPAPVAQLGRAPAVFRARLAPVGDGTVAVLLEDVTEARRVEAVRRDFVANVSHELKTPVGAMGLLAEAMVGRQRGPGRGPALRRPGAARGRAAGPARAGAHRPVPPAGRRAAARPRPRAGRPRRRRGRRPGPHRRDRPRHRDRPRRRRAGSTVLGSEQQLVTALANLLDNAVHYSPDGTRVAVGVRVRRATSSRSASATRASGSPSPTSSASSSASTGPTPPAAGPPAAPGSGWPSSSTSPPTTAGR